MLGQYTHAVANIADGNPMLGQYTHAIWVYSVILPVQMNLFNCDTISFNRYQEPIKLQKLSDEVFKDKLSHLLCIQMFQSNNKPPKDPVCPTNEFFNARPTDATDEFGFEHVLIEGKV